MKKRPNARPNQSFQAVHIQPKNVTQDFLLRSIEDSPLVVTTGPAGVGKTYIAVNAAVNLLAKGRARRLILSRTNVPTGKTLGSFPGDINDKLGPWLAPMTSVLKTRLSGNQYSYMLEKGLIQFQPLETIRGASFDDSVILVDEAQNLTFEEVKAITTRIGENSHMVLMGDPMQSDQKQSGLPTLKKIIEKQSLDVPVITFTVDHIVRSDIVGQLVRAYINAEKSTT